MDSTLIHLYTIQFVIISLNWWVWNLFWCLSACFQWPCGFALSALPLSSLPNMCHHLPKLLLSQGASWNHKVLIWQMFLGKVFLHVISNNLGFILTNNIWPNAKILNGFSRRFFLGWSQWSRNAITSLINLKTFSPILSCLNTSLLLFNTSYIFQNKSLKKVIIEFNVLQLS